MSETAPPRIRLAKRMAEAGLCSRRQAEEIIRAGRVTVNEEAVTTPAFTVSGEDKVTVDGKPLETRHKQVLPRLFCLHKPRGFMCTSRDPQGRPTVFDLIPPGGPRLVLIGRLDFNSEGLLLLCSDGDLAQRMMKPATALPRVYRARVHGTPNAEHVARLAEGPTVAGTHYRPIKLALGQGEEKGKNRWVTLTLTEGKNREIRRIFDHLGMPVSRLIRIGYGPFRLDKIPPKGIREIPASKVKKFLGDLP